MFDIFKRVGIFDPEIEEMLFFRSTSKVQGLSKIPQFLELNDDVIYVPNPDKLDQSLNLIEKTKLDF